MNFYGKLPFKLSAINLNLNTNNLKTPDYDFDDQL